MKKSMFVIMVLISLLAAQVFAAQSMKIAVAAADKTATAAVIDRAASAPYFLFFDGKGKLLEAVDNPLKSADNPGLQIINFLAAKGATVMVAGFFGPRIVDVAKAKGITPVSFKGTAQDAVKSVLQSRNADKR
jgi:predicted Fe-Mo cluster-binding NifX family protein